MESIAKKLKFDESVNISILYPFRKEWRVCLSSHVNTDYFVHIMRYVEEGVGGYYFEICGRRGGGILCIGTLFIRICFGVN
jgi:hypothetical protein